MSAISSPGWSVRPSFVPHAPTSPVTLLLDDAGLTQLAGVYPVAWQTPWEQIGALELVRSGRTMALFATVDGVRYRWQNHSLDDYEDLRALVLARGGTLARRRRRAASLVITVALLLASSAGGIAAWLNRPNSELTQVRAANLTLKDLPSGFATVSASVLGYVATPPGEVVTSTSTPAPSANSIFERSAGEFQSCLGVSAGADRVYGAAGQLPDYQVTSPYFATSQGGGIQVISISQYYASTQMVERDVAEMSRHDFGACFARSNADMLVSAATGTFTRFHGGENWSPVTYAKAWARGGVIQLTLPGVTTPLHLVMVVTAAGHYELTLAALVSRWPSSESVIATLLNTLKVRLVGPSQSAAV